jgi:threonine synthase
MKYISTRDLNNEVEAHEAIKQGIAEDGGLFVPNSIPKISLNDLKEMTNMNYSQRAERILKEFLTDYTKEELMECTQNSYNSKNFNTNEIAPVKRLNSNEYVLELWHGPTCAFKDMALQILPQFLTRAIRKSEDSRKVVILTATSGDTGKAALEGFKDVDGTEIIVFYPKEGVSKIQELQMTTQDGKNTFVVAIEGNFDDAQTGVKKIFTDKEFINEINNKGYVFSSANSINLGRLVPQIVYYFSGYLDMVKKGYIQEKEKINVVVPTGNFGNILAAFYAKEMGLPIEKLICASNENNVLTDFINQGKYDKNRTLKTTISPSMDILLSSNLERLLFELSENKEIIKEYMHDLKIKGFYEIDKELKHKIDKYFWADFCTEEETKEVIKRVYNKFNYVVDTHTAVAIGVLDKYKENFKDDTKTLVVSTASPFKFSNSVLEA